jgi:hypothetical protein
MASITRRLLVQGACALWLALDTPALAQAPAKGSTAFEQFRWSFFEDKDSPRNGLDTGALRQLAGKERARAEQMLIRYLPDARGIIGLGELRSQRAAPALRRLFRAERRAQIAARRVPTGWSPYRVAYLAKALWRIKHDPQLLAAVAEVLGSAELAVQRMQGAIALSEFRDPAAVGALVDALDDPDGLVRSSATRSLLTIHGLGGAIDTMRKDLDNMMYRVMSDDAERREGGKRDILAAIAGRPIAR